MVGRGGRAELRRWLGSLLGKGLCSNPEPGDSVLCPQTGPWQGVWAAQGCWRIKVQESQPPPLGSLTFEARELQAVVLTFEVSHLPGVPPSAFISCHLSGNL
jgi:hypothetical protein